MRKSLCIYLVVLVGLMTLLNSCGKVSQKEKRIIGKWVCIDEDAPISLEFFKRGRLIIRPVSEDTDKFSKRTKEEGTYKFIGENKIELNIPALGESETSPIMDFEVSENKLLIVDPKGGFMSTMEFRRIR